MKPDSKEPADLTPLLRQQLILAQVRIMELEDTRDELVPRLAEMEKLLATAQTLAEDKAGEAAHLEKVRANLQAEFEHMRHMQHVTNEALNSARVEIGGYTSRQVALLSEVEHLQILIGQLAASERRHIAAIAELNASREALRGESAERLARINQLGIEQRFLKSSRSWRWTAWLRSIERAFK